MDYAKNIKYLKGSGNKFNPIKHLLDIYFPEDYIGLADVLIFIHGGSWSHGNKEQYEKLGKTLAEKNIVSVLINYRLAPEVNFEGMGLDCALAVKWVYENIEQFGGDPEKIFLSGYSSGGHLAALITLNSEFFDRIHAKKIVKGCILIDAFGLCLTEFQKKHDSPYLMKQFDDIFTLDPINWKRASPVEFISKNDVPFLIFTGENSPLPLRFDNKYFVDEMEKKNKHAVYELIEGKSHLQMITQLEDKTNPIYEKIINFMKAKVEV